MFNFVEILALFVPTILSNYLVYCFIKVIVIINKIYLFNKQ